MKSATKAPDREDIEKTVGQMIDAARSYMLEAVEPDRTKATDYYHGRPFGNEETGRSQVVLTVVRDTARTFMQNLMRIFFGAERPVEYEPHRLEEAPNAAQATDYVGYIVTQDNRGYSIVYSAFMDALVRRIGFIKWWWEASERVTGYTATGLSEDDVLRLLMDPELEIEIQDEASEPGQPKTYEATVTRRVKEGRARLAAIPGEEMGWNRTARSLTDARIVYHSRPDMRLDELLAMGYKEEDLEGLGGSSSILDGQTTTWARRTDRGGRTLEDETVDPKTRPIRYTEAYTYLEVDKKIGVALYKTCHAGDQHKLLGEPVLMTRRPFAMFCPYPEPHTFDGLGLSDSTMDLQLIESQVLRGTLDSLSLALQQDTEVVDGQVNMKDLLNPERGKIIRVRQAGVIREITHRFLGEMTLPILDKLDDVLADRTGKTKAAEGLDADVMQSTTKAAVAGTLTKAQQSVEYVARNFAEGMKDLYIGLLQLVAENQDQPRVLRLRGEYTAVDPRSWNATMDVRVNVALGAGLPEDRINALKQIVADQTAIVTELGPDNPLVTPMQLRAARAKIVELSGFPSADEFYQRITPAIEQQIKTDAANAQPPIDPAIAAQQQIEASKLQLATAKQEADLQFRQQELALKETEMRLVDDRERDKAAATVATALAEIEAKYAAHIDREKFKAQQDAERAALDASVTERQSQRQAAIDERKALIKAESERHRAELEAQTKLAVAKASAPIHVTVNQPKPSGKITVTRDKATGDLTAQREGD